MDLSLLGKNALVGGGSAGIGKAIAQELALLGANVTLMARNKVNLEKSLEALDTSLGQCHSYLQVDYADTADLDSKIKQLLSSRAFHILINNTGGPPGGPIVLADQSQFLAAYHNHLICNHLLAVAVLPGMKQAGFGRIINVISTSVKEPIDGLGVSNTTRWAVASWAKTLSVEVGQFGVTVNNVLPGFTQTGRLEEIIEKRATALNADPNEVEASMKSLVPLRRFGSPNEIAAGVAFLASPAASYINGINLVIDGGRTKSL
jgi:3-oxoacyl-[acyl-carrier protein] reductase